MSLKKPADTPDLFRQNKHVPDYELEKASRLNGLWPVAGCDEAGRGPLAGPVVAAAVILHPDRIPDGLNDSKKLSAKKREKLFDIIMADAIVSVASSGPELIDKINILAASLDAMRRAVNGLSIAPALVLTDGRDRPPGIACQAEPLIKGDSRSLSIAAASILAKVTRDRMMTRAAAVYPAYGFEAHAGYGTARHLKALAEAGPCLLHRKSFRPVKERLEIESAS